MVVWVCFNNQDQIIGIYATEDEARKFMRFGYAATGGYIEEWPVLGGKK